METLVSDWFRPRSQTEQYLTRHFRTSVSGFRPCELSTVCEKFNARTPDDRCRLIRCSRVWLIGIGDKGGQKHDDGAPRTSIRRCLASRVNRESESRDKSRKLSVVVHPFGHPIAHLAISSLVFHPLGRWRERPSYIDDTAYVVQLPRRDREEEHRQQPQSQPDVTEFVQEVEQFAARQQREIGR